MGRRPSNYMTKQGEAVLACVKGLQGSHATVAQVAEHLQKAGFAIGRTTIYRQLEKLVQAGKVRKYTLDPGSGACYQAASEPEAADGHYHLKCEHCGEVIHARDGLLPDVAEQIVQEYRFQVNVMKTVFYGTCNRCRRNG